jgi:hypothetical protein
MAETPRRVLCTLRWVYLMKYTRIYADAQGESHL